MKVWDWAGIELMTLGSAINLVTDYATEPSVSKLVFQKAENRKDLDKMIEKKVWRTF